MEKGRDVYKLDIYGKDLETIKTLIISFLKLNEATIDEKNGEKYFRMGLGGFKYFIDANTLEITAWEISAMGKEWKLEQKSKLNQINSFHGAEYKRLLYALFKDIENISSNTQDEQFNKKDKLDKENEIDMESDFIKNNFPNKQDIDEKGFISAGIVFLIVEFLGAITGFLGALGMVVFPIISGICLFKRKRKIAIAFLISSIIIFILGIVLFKINLNLDN